MGLQMMIVQTWEEMNQWMDVHQCWRVNDDGDDDDEHGHELANIRTNSLRVEDQLSRMQLKAWAPSELLDKCCVKWILHGQQRLHPQSGHLHSSHDHHGRRRRLRLFHRHRRGHGDDPHNQRAGAARHESAAGCHAGNHQPCNGYCRRSHPTITLYFEPPSSTIAIISHPLGPFVEYFRQKASSDDSIIQISPMYCILDGFVREHATTLRADFAPHLVSIAQNALEASDAAHKEYVRQTSVHLQRAQRRFDQLEVVLDICRQHRLGDDLDVFSIHCLRQANRSMGRIAALMMEQKMQAAQIVITPFVDGFEVDGYSVFGRHGDGDTVVRMEHGNSVEYSKRSPIVCQPKMMHSAIDDGGQVDICSNDNKESSNAHPNAIDGVSLMSIAEQKLIEKSTRMHSYRASATGDDGLFGWHCEELSFATLEREWGDIMVHEYVGQRVMIGFRFGTGQVIPLASYYLPPTIPAGFHCVNKPSLRLRCHVTQNQVSQVDEVTMSYRGSVEDIRVDVGFLGLVRAQARWLVDEVEERQRVIQQRRPLLDFEKEYLTEVRRMASAG